MVWIRNLLLVLAWGGIAALGHPVAGHHGSWALFSFGLGTLLCWHIWQLSRVTRWTRDLKRPPPPSAGSWDDALARIYRHLRSQERQLALLEGNVQGFLSAAQALPDGLVTLDEDFHIDWCNRIARHHLGLRLPEDRGHSLLNLVRSPEFVRYARQLEWPSPVLVRSPGSGDRVLMVQLISYNKRQRMLLTRDVTADRKAGNHAPRLRGQRVARTAHPADRAGGLSGNPDRDAGRRPAPGAARPVSADHARTGAAHAGDRGRPAAPCRPWNRRPPPTRNRLACRG